MVETWLEAHCGQIPDEQWRRRRDAWTPELSAGGWSNTLAEMSDGTRTRTCIFLVYDAAGDQLDGLVMGAPARHGPWRDAGQIVALYVRRARRGQGLGLELLQTAIADQQHRGFERLIIGCLDTNTSARGFYEHLGGIVVGQMEDEEYGFTNTQVLYGWSDLASLIA